MDFKKNPRVDIHRKSTLFFNIGLVIALFIVNTAFEWTTYDKASSIDLELNIDDINNFEATKEIVKDAVPPVPKFAATKVVEKKKTLEEELEELEVDMAVDLTVDLEMP